MKIIPKPLRRVLKNVRTYIFRQPTSMDTPPVINNSILPPPTIRWEDTVEFTFPISGGQVIKVYDGDTITIAAKLPFAGSPLYRLSVRLNGIDTPEIKGKSDEEKECAKMARDAVADLILHKEISLKNIQSEKYGRILADVYLGDLCVNEWIVRERLGVKYDGGTKLTPVSWKKYKETGNML